MSAAVVAVTLVTDAVDRQVNNARKVDCTDPSLIEPIELDQVTLRSATVRASRCAGRSTRPCGAVPRGWARASDWTFSRACSPARAAVPPVQAVAAQRGLIEPSWCIGVRLADLHQGVQIGEISGV